MATYAFIHGAGDVAWSWGLVAAAMGDYGHEAIAVDLPCEDDSAGWSDYADAVVEAIGERGNVIVVAHSLGGFTAPLVCDRVPADLLILVAPMIPKPGERADEWWANTGNDEAYAAQGLDDDDELAIFLHDVSPLLASEALARGRDQSSTPMREPPLARPQELADRLVSDLDTLPRSVARAGTSAGDPSAHTQPDRESR